MSTETSKLSSKSLHWTLVRHDTSAPLRALDSCLHFRPLALTFLRSDVPVSSLHGSDDFGPYRVHLSHRGCKDSKGSNCPCTSHFLPHCYSIPYNCVSLTLPLHTGHCCRWRNWSICGSIGEGRGLPCHWYLQLRCQDRVPEVYRMRSPHQLQKGGSQLCSEARVPQRVRQIFFIRARLAHRIEARPSLTDQQRPLQFLSSVRDTDSPLLHSQSRRCLRIRWRRYFRHLR